MMAAHGGVACKQTTALYENYMLSTHPQPTTGKQPTAHVPAPKEICEVQQLFR